MGSVPHRPLHLDVPRVTDQRDLHALAVEALGLDVDLGDQRAGGVDRPQLLGRRRLSHGRGHAVGAVDEQRTLGNLGGILDEDGALGPQALDHVPVVDDLVAYVDRRAEAIERLLDDLERPVDTGTEAARAGQLDAHAGQASVPATPREPVGERLHSISASG